MKKRTEKEIMREFERLVCALSPENLSCDGELSHAQTGARHAKLMADWRRLEGELGRKVSEDEVWRGM